MTKLTHNIIYWVILTIFVISIWHLPFFHYFIAVACFVGVYCLELFNFDDN